MVYPFSLSFSLKIDDNNNDDDGYRQIFLYRKISTTFPSFLTNEFGLFIFLFYEDVRHVHELESFHFRLL